jgi:hypothetical protein
MQIFVLKVLSAAIFLVTVAFLFTTPVQARERNWQTTEEYIGGTLAHTVDIGTRVAVDGTNAALTFCQRIGRDTIANDVDFNSDTHFENRTTSDHGNGYFHYFSPPVEKRIDAGAYTRSSVRLTCGTKK